MSRQAASASDTTPNVYFMVTNDACAPRTAHGRVPNLRETILALGFPFRDRRCFNFGDSNVDFID